MVRKRSKSKKTKRAKPKTVARRMTRPWPLGWTAMLVVIFSFAIAAILHVRAKLVVVQLGYQISEAAGTNKRLLADFRKLQLEVATLRNPRRLRRLAKEKLGLAEPDPLQILRIRNRGGKVASTALDSPGKAY
jgi:cell division protein FtsL